MAAGARDAAQWNLFSDWCAAMGDIPLPASPLTLARFLLAHPAAANTHRRRVGVINAMHRNQGFAPPGEAETVRDLIDARRQNRRRSRACNAAAAICQLPQKGWPTALFARRDAMLLVLTAVGMPATQIAGLRIGDIEEATGEDALKIATGGETLWTPEELSELGVSPTGVWRRWEEVRRVQHQLPATRRVAQLLGGASFRRLYPAPPELPLVTPLDRWGATPLRPTPLSAAAIAGIICAHLEGSARAHRPVRRTAPEPPPVTATDPEPSTPVVLDPDTVARGLAARRRSAELLSGVDCTLEEIEARADALLSGLLNLLEEPDLRRGGCA